MELSESLWGTIVSNIANSNIRNMLVRSSTQNSLLPRSNLRSTPLELQGCAGTSLSTFEEDREQFSRFWSHSFFARHNWSYICFVLPREQNARWILELYSVMLRDTYTRFVNFLSFAALFLFTSMPKNNFLVLYDTMCFPGDCMEHGLRKAG